MEKLRLQELEKSLGEQKQNALCIFHQLVGRYEQVCELVKECEILEQTTTKKDLTKAL